MYTGHNSAGYKISQLT